MTNFKAASLAILIVLGACSSYPKTAFSPQSDGLRVEGVIDDTTFDSLQQALRNNPNLDTLVLHSVPGSVDDEQSLIKLSRFIRAQGLTTRVPSDGVVASGGTDMVLMGATRIIEPGACIGVHTWATGGLFGFEAGSELPKSDPVHQLYLTFYQEMGIPEAFYWYTLAVAGPNDVHWMSPEEINRFGLSTRPAPNALDETAKQRNARCEQRV